MGGVRGWGDLTALGKRLLPNLAEVASKVALVPSVRSEQDREPPGREGRCLLHIMWWSTATVPNAGLADNHGPQKVSHARPLSVAELGDP